MPRTSQVRHIAAVSLLALLFSFCPLALCNSTEIVVAYYIDPPRVALNSSGNLTGIFGDLLDSFFSTSQVTPVLKQYASQDYSDCLLIDNCSIIFNYKELVNDQPANNISLALENYTRIDLTSETFYIFYPNLLTKLIQCVLYELFFVVVIVLGPWIIINALIYYIFENKSYRKMPILMALFHSAKKVIFMGNRTYCGKFYSWIFYLLTILIVMLLLADFIFVVSNLLIIHNITSLDDAASKQSTLCVLTGDNMMIEMIQANKEIFYETGDTVEDCIDQLNNLQTASISISQYDISAFFKENPSYNNQFRFTESTSSFATNWILVHKNYTELADDISMAVSSLQKSGKIDLSIQNYTIDPVFNKLAPTSIFSSSVLFIFCSLTLSSMFLLFFIIVLLRRECRRPKEKRNKNVRIKKNTKKTYGFKPVGQESETPKQEELVIYPQGYDRPSKRSVIEEKSKRKSTSKKPVEKRNHTLSLSGPINTQNFQGKPDKSWLKIDAQSSKEEGSFKFHGTSDFEHQVSSVSKANFSAQSIHREFFEDNQNDKKDNQTEKPGRSKPRELEIAISKENKDHQDITPQNNMK